MERGGKVTFNKGKWNWFFIGFFSGYILAMLLATGSCYNGEHTGKREFKLLGGEMQWEDGPKAGIWEKSKWSEIR